MTVFPILIPTLLATPVTNFNLRALGSLVNVAGPALNKRVGIITSTLVTVLEDENNQEIVAETNNCLGTVFRSIEDLEGLNTLMLLLLGW